MPSAAATIINTHSVIKANHLILGSVSECWVWNEEKRRCAESVSVSVRVERLSGFEVSRSV